jgi:hypothetical protein
MQVDVEYVLSCGSAVIEPQTNAVTPEAGLADGCCHSLRHDE